MLVMQNPLPNRGLHVPLDFLAFILMIENGWAFCTSLGFFF